MPEPAPRLFWFRRDLRLADHPGLAAALAGGGPLLLVFVLDPETEAFGAASRWRLGRALDALSGRLEAAGSKLVLRRGAAPRRSSGWRGMLARGGALDAPLRPRHRRPRHRREGGAAGRGHRRRQPPGLSLARALAARDRRRRPLQGLHPVLDRDARAGGPRPAARPGEAPAPARWPTSDALDDWRLDAAMDRGGAVVARHAEVGEAAAAARLRRFLDGPIAAYHRDRDRPDRAGTSRVSENLTWGEMSPRTLWHAGAAPAPRARRAPRRS